MKPTIVLDESCGVLAKAVSAFSPIFVFRRSGGFLVEPRLAAAELFEALRANNVAPPFILVGASYAAFTHLLFAFQWREQVAGVILVDPSHPKQAEVALPRLPPERAGSSRAVEDFRKLLRGFGPGWETGCQQVSLVGEIGSVRLTVLAAGAPEIPAELGVELKGILIRERHELLRGFCKLTTRGEIEIVEGVGHDITSAAPDVVLGSIRKMIKASGS